MARMTDDEIVSLIEAEESEALGSDYDDLNAQRADALDRYNQRPYGWEVEGRSQFVSNAIRDQIEAIMPSVGRVFLSGDEVGRFEAIGPEDEDAAEVESLVVNHCVAKGGGWQAIYSAMKDALLLKNGYIQVNWRTDSAIVSETYKGLADEELALLMQDKDVKVTEHTEYPDVAQAMPMLDQMGQPIPVPNLHDVRVERTKPEERLELQAVPPDEVLVSSRHRSVSLLDCDFVQIRRSISIGELRDAGYDVPDDLGDEGFTTEERVARARFDWFEDELKDTPDETRRRVVFRQTWMRTAIDGGKVPKLWRFCVVGKRLLHSEEADHIPVAAFSPIWYPHSHVGVSYYDLLTDLAEAETVIARQYFDSLYLSTSPRIAVDYNRVNLDDLLTSRPGGVVRSDGPPGDTMLPLVSPDVGPTAQAGLEWIAGQREQRTGIARINAGASDPNILNRTASGAMLMQQAGQARLEATCRLLAEGVKDLFLICHAVLLKHSTKPIQLKLKNQWTAVNPREWTRRTDFAVSVALGTGAPEQQLGKLQMLTQQIPGLMQLGLMSPKEVYNLVAETLRVSGYRTPQKFLREPQEGQPPPPQQPPPEVLAAQAIAQGNVAKAQMDAQASLQKAQADGQIMLQKAQGDAATEYQKAQLHESEENKRNLMDNATKIIIARMQHALSAMNAERDREDAMENAVQQRAQDAEMAAIQAQIQDEAGRLQ